MLYITIILIGFRKTVSNQKSATPKNLEEFANSEKIQTFGVPLNDSTGTALGHLAAMPRIDLVC